MRIYAYHAKPPIKNAEMVTLQLRLAHSYQCALVAIERQRRAAVDHLYRHACPKEHADYEAVKLATARAITAVKATRTTSGDMLEPDEEMKAEQREISKLAVQALKDAREREKMTRQAWYDAKRAATPKLKRRLQMCDRGARARNKRAYNLASTVGLAWGTRLKIGESVERAAKASAKEGTLPKFPCFDGGGALAVQLQGGLAETAVLDGDDTRLRLESVDAHEWFHMQGANAWRVQLTVEQRLNALRVRRGQRHEAGKEHSVLDLKITQLEHLLAQIEKAPQSRQKLIDASGLMRDPGAVPVPRPGSKRGERKRMIAHLRVGSDGRDPVWASWPIVFHRELPVDSSIKWAQVHARPVGDRMIQQGLLTVDPKAAPDRAEGPTLAVNLGWRTLLDGGLRVAYAVGSDGYEEEVRVPPKYVTGVAHVDSIRSIRDKNFELAKRSLSEWCDDVVIPEWLLDGTKWMEQWRSQKHLVFLLREWRRKRFAGDDKIFRALMAWEQKDRHLRFWECDERTKLLRQREGFYRQVAARWAQRYARIIVTDMDLRDFAELPAPEDAKDTKDALQRRTRFLAAPSELRGAIKNACSTRGTMFAEVSGAYKSQTCSRCGGVLSFPARQEAEVTCALCGHREDQDRRHDLNLLAADQKRARGEEPAPGEKKSRWQKRTKKAA